MIEEQGILNSIEYIENSVVYDEERQIVSLLETALINYDFVIITDDEMILKYLSKRSNNITVFTNRPTSITAVNSITVLTETDYATLLSIYQTYECSDHLIALSKNKLYASYPALWNYVESGVITVEEFMRAILRR